MIPDNTIEKVHLANDVGQDLKKAWLQGVVDFGTKPVTPAWQPSTVESIPPLTLNRTTVRDLGQPPNLDVRKNANPHSTDYYTKGAVYPPKWSSGGW
tara:strand:+ start:424 stop:714 length:291 start_codon:yes stop_codon:yes gene_type:complete